MARSLNWWATIALDSVTLYATTADVDTGRTVGGAGKRWLPILIVESISQQFRDLNLPAEVPAVVRIKLVNRDGCLDPYLGFGGQARVWDNRVVTIRYGGSAGSAFTSMTREFVGRIRRGTLRHSQSEVSFDLYDIRQAHDKRLPLTKFDYDTLPNAADGVNGLYIPIIYGDFTRDGGPVNGGRLPAYCTDTTATTAYPFTVAAHTISALVVYWYDASADTWSLLTGGGVDYTANAVGFTLSAAQSAATDITADIYTVNCKGRTTVPLITGGGAALLEYAVDIMADLLVNYGGAVIGDINSADWLTTHNDGDQHINRRWISDQTSVMELIAEIAFENNYLFYTSQYQYELNFALPKSAVTATIAAALPVEDSVESIYDPDSIYINNAVSTYDLICVGDAAGNYRYSVELTNATAVTEYGDIVSGNFTFKWLYSSANVSLQTERKLLVMSSKAHYVSFQIRADDPSDTFWRLKLADTVVLNHWQYVNTPLQIHSISRNGQTGIVSVQALAVQDAFQVCQWSGVADGSDVTYPAKWNDASITQVPAGRYF